MKFRFRLCPLAISLPLLTITFPGLAEPIPNATAQEIMTMFSEGDDFDATKYEGMYSGRCWNLDELNAQPRASAMVIRSGSTQRGPETYLALTSENPETTVSFYDKWSIGTVYALSMMSAVAGETLEPATKLENGYEHRYRNSEWSYTVRRSNDDKYFATYMNRSERQVCYSFKIKK